jgi:hypothetical protein
MKNIGIMIMGVSLAILVAVGAFFSQQHGNARGDALLNASPASSGMALAELRKTQASLQRLEASVTPATRRHLTALRIQDDGVGLFPGNFRPAQVAATPDFAGTAGGTIPVSPEASPLQTTPGAAMSALARTDVHAPENAVSFIYLSPDIRRAIIDGNFVQEGEILPNGARVVSMNEGAVMVRKTGKKYRLEVPKRFPAHTLQEER